MRPRAPIPIPLGEILVIVYNKPGYLARLAGQDLGPARSFKIDTLTTTMEGIDAKHQLSHLPACGLEATNMKLLCGPVEIGNLQKLGDVAQISINKILRVIEVQDGAELYGAWSVSMNVIGTAL
jgi:hypothetical protein